MYDWDAHCWISCILLIQVYRLLYFRTDALIWYITLMFFSISSGCKLLETLTLSASSLFLSLRKAVEEAMDPSLAGITAYVSQDCTGMKDEPAVDKTGYWARRPNWPFVFHHLSAAERLWSCLEGWQDCIYTTTNTSTTKICNIQPLLNPDDFGFWFMFVLSIARADDSWSKSVCFDVLSESGLNLSATGTWQSRYSGIWKLKQLFW